MIKQKLIESRKNKKISQESMAFYMGITQSQYCRRENGNTKISINEWHKLAKILETTLDEIYEPEENIGIDIDVLLQNANSSKLYNMKISELTDDIQRLKTENKRLKDEMKKLQGNDF